MDKTNDMVFNNQIFNSGAVQIPTTPVDQLNNNLSIIYGQGKHQEIIDAIVGENITKLEELLRSLPHPDRYINTIDPMFKQTLFYKAVSIPNEKAGLEMSKILLSFGGKIDRKDVHGQSPMFYICKDGKADILKLFLENGADINETDNFRQSPLFYASRDGKYEMVKFMISNRANPNHKDKVEETALFYAARDNRFDTCKVLIDMGADVNVIDQKKQTALYFAKKNSHKDIEELLIMHGALNTKDGLLRQSDLRKKLPQGMIKSSKYETDCSTIGE